MSKKGGPSIKNMHIAFGAACVVLLLATVYAFIQDYQRDFTPFQQQYYQKELERLKKERADAEKEENEADYQEAVKAADAKIDVDKKALDAKQSIIDENLAKEKKIDDSLQLAKRQLNFLKADLSTAVYEVDAGKRKKESLEPLKQKVDEKFIDVNKLQAERDIAQNIIDTTRADLKAAQSAHDQLVSDKTDLDAKIRKAIGNPVINLAKDAPGINFIAPRYHIEQVVLNDLPEDRFFAKTMRVDRCVSCHKAIDNPDPSYTEHDTKKLEPYLRSHPRLDLFVSPNSKHPYKLFGCTICHQGKPMGTTFTRAAHSPRNEEQAKQWEKTYDWEYLHYWDNKMLPLQHTEAACLKCHKGVDDVPQANKLNEGRYLFRDRGCANCHMGPSGDKDMAWVGRIGPDLRRIGEKATKDWARGWIANPWSFRPSTKMPRFFGLENRTDTDMDLTLAKTNEHMPRDPVEIEAIATYLFTVSKLREVAPPEPPKGDAENGQLLFEGIGCLGCHSTLDTKEKKEKYDFNRHGPDLSRVGDKLSPGWLYAWLKSPRNYWAETKMPNLRLTDQEAADITAYLLSKMSIKNADPALNLKPAAALTEAPNEAFAEVIRDKLKATVPAPILDGMLAEPMKMMEDSLKNKVKYAGNVDTGDGEWSEAQIAKIKEILSKDANPDRAAKAFYAGETLIQHHGCFGCHNIQGWTFAPLTCVNLAGEADKDLEKLDFGKTLGDHSIGHTKWDWFYTKIARPRVYDQGKLDLIKPFDRLRMPWFGFEPHGGEEAAPKEGAAHAEEHAGKLSPVSNPDLADNGTKYGLTPTQIERLVTHILSLTMEQVPVEKQHAPSQREIAVDRGHRVIRELNCTGCHIIGMGGDVEHGAEATPTQIPAEGLVSLLAQAGNKASQELKKPGNGILLDEDAAQLDYTSDAVSLKGIIGAQRGAFLTDVTAPIILGERKVRTTPREAPHALGFHFEKDKEGDPAWSKFSKLVSEERYLTITKYFYGNEKDAKEAYKKIADKFYVETAVYEQLAGSANMGLSALEIEHRKVAKTFVEPIMLNVRFQRGEGRIAPFIIQFEKDNHDNDTASQQQAPPSLGNEGGKVQPDWLYQFLHNVYPLRQGLGIRMPSFWTDGPYSKYKSIYPAGHLSAVDPAKRDASISGEPLPSAEAPKVSDLPDDTAQAVEYFVHDARTKAYGSQPGPMVESDRETYKLGEHLVMGDAKDGGMDCTQCHAVGNKVPKQAKWAPNLINAKRRLRSDWVERFLIFPAAIYPWTNMPNNFHFDWDNYKYSATEPFRGVQENKEENVKQWATKLRAAEYFLMHSGDAEIGELQK